MTSFTVRVELHDANPNDYSVLHEAMEDEGFSRTITADSGITYHLPEAEYVISADITRADVLARAKEAANSTKKKFGILVTESNGRTMVGLKKA